MLNAAKKGKIDYLKAIHLLSTNPAKRFGIYPQKGVIAEGSDADLVIYDPNSPWIINKEMLETQGKDCAQLYYGDKIHGKVTQTFIKGNLGYDNGKFNKNNKYTEYIRSKKYNR